MGKTIFGTKYKHETGKPSPAGNKIQMEHTAHMGLDGKRKLIKDNARPIYEIIQASREQTEIERIVKRAMEGDASVLDAMKGQYLDITGAPKSLAQAQQIIINAKRDFDKLDTETKKKFDNNVEIFIASAGSKDWLDKMGITAEMEEKAKIRAEETAYEKDKRAAMANLAKTKKEVSESNSDN